MEFRKYSFTSIIVLVSFFFLLFFFLIVALSARFSLAEITSAPYEFIENFVGLWSPWLSTFGILVVAGLVLLALHQMRLIHETEREQLIRALHDEIYINFSIVAPLRALIKNTVETRGLTSTDDLSIDERRELYEQLDMAVFNRMKNSGQLYWLGDLRTDLISCYRLINLYDSDKHFKPNHFELLTNILEQLENTQRGLEDSFSFVSHYARRGRAA